MSDFIVSFFSLIGGIIRWVFIYKCKKSKFKEILLSESQADIIIGLALILLISLIIIFINLKWWK